jgi:hypothetical protein
MTSSLLSRLAEGLAPGSGSNSPGVLNTRSGPPVAGIPSGKRGTSTLPSETGIASITHEGKTFRFRTNPNEITWTYTLNTFIENTYGGRVIQLLSTKIDDLVIKADCGSGRWPYMMEVANFMKNLMIDQRQGSPATFEYTSRQWKLDVYAVSIPFADDFSAVAREFEMNFKVQEDVSGVMSQASLSSELERLRNGMGWHKSKYNQPNAADQHDGESGWFDNPINTPQVANALAEIPGANTVLNIIQQAQGNPGA